jgi:hypothetical protein
VKTQSRPANLRAEDRMKGFAVILAVVAALLVAGLGSAVATTLITSAMIKDHTIKNVDIADNAVNGRVVANGSLAAGDLSAAAKRSLGQAWAVVKQDGSLARGTAGTTSASLGVDGQYEVDFGRDVSACAYDATVGGHDSSTSGFVGEISVAPRDGDASAVFVQTFDVSTGVEANLPFHLVAFC